MKRMLNLSVLALAIAVLAGVQLSLAQGCENKGCSAGSKGTRRCKISKPGVNCSTDSAGRCAETAC